MASNFTEEQKQEWLAAQEEFWRNGNIQLFSAGEWKDFGTIQSFNCLDPRILYRVSPKVEYVPLEASDIPKNQSVWMRSKLDRQLELLVLGIYPSGLQLYNVFVNWQTASNFWERLNHNGDWVDMKKVLKS